MVHLSSSAFVILCFALCAPSSRRQTYTKGRFIFNFSLFAINPNTSCCMTRLSVTTVAAKTLALVGSRKTVKLLLLFPLLSVSHTHQKQPISRTKKCSCHQNREGECSYDQFPVSAFNRRQSVGHCWPPHWPSQRGWFSGIK